MSARQFQQPTSSRQRYNVNDHAEVIQDEETFEELSERERAAAYLESTEMLMWIATARNEVWL